MSSHRLYADGASEGNPGPSGAGVVIENPQGVKLKEISCYLGRFSNNVAEYLALIIGLLEAKLLGIKSLEVYLDSELLVNQINGVYKVRSEHLKSLWRLVRFLNQKFGDIRYNYIERRENKAADKLATQAINNAII